jgi:methylated-DNA-[protein]-cysteine S-methyltransferase
MSQDSIAMWSFKTPLGWIALLWCGKKLRQVSFGHHSDREAIAALNPSLAARAARQNPSPALVHRLVGYTRGKPESFADVELDFSGLTVFQQRVLRRCQQIPYGHTVSYGQLAAMAGYPGAARAVGNCMAANRFPLVVPCHRVVAADGSLGKFSAPGGKATKRLLLAMEAHAGKPPRI